MRRIFQALISVSLMLSACAALAQEQVTFPSLGITVRVQIKGNVYRPQTSAKAPAMVILHGCGGVRSNDREWAELLAANGYVALVVDSLGPRNIATLCGGVGPPSFLFRVRDAFGAALWLQQQPYVDAERIGVMGFSHGGLITLALAAEEARRVAAPEAPRFRISVPLYPTGCGVPGYMLDASGKDIIERRVRIPMLILHGAADDWTPSAPCKTWVDAAYARGEPVAINVYPDAHHSFDRGDLQVQQVNFERQDRSGERGVTIGFNRAARDAARRDLLVFLGKSL